jgi:hypothetical protein
VRGERRRLDYVIARSIARILALGVALMALANLAVLYGAFLWLRNDHAAHAVLWCLAGAMSVQFAALIAALVAFGWSL